MLRGCLSLAVLSFAIAGCNKPTGGPVVQEKVEETEQLVFPLTSVLGKSPTYRQCKDALQRYDAQSGAARKGQLGQRAAEAVPRLAQSMPLSDADRKELLQTEFNPADALYLEEMVFLADVEKSLRLREIPMPQLAEVACRWVSRHIYLNPAADEAVFPVPSQVALVAGSGTVWDRLYVCMNLLRFCDVDTFLLATEELEKTPFVRVNAGNAPPQFAPVWALAIRHDTEFIIFDPMTGDTVRGGDQNSLTWSKLKTDAGTLAALAQVARPTSVTAEKLAQSRPYLTLPLSALSMRMQSLDELSRREYRLAADPKRTIENCAPALTAAGWKAAVWNTADDPLSFSRVYAFLISPTQIPNRTPLDAARERVVPWEGFPRIFDRLDAQVGKSALIQYFATNFLKMHFGLEGELADPPAETLFR
jgi:hypothetical protein